MAWYRRASLLKRSPCRRRLLEDSAKNLLHILQLPAEDQDLLVGEFGNFRASMW